MNHRHSIVISLSLTSALLYGAACTPVLDVGDSGSGGAAASSGAASSGGKSGAGGRQTGGTSNTGGAATSPSGGRMNHHSGGNPAGGAPNSSDGGSESSGGSAGEASTGGSWLDAYGTLEPVPVSAEGCPTGPLVDKSECESSGQVCGYSLSSKLYEECTCFRGPQGNHWDCELAGGEHLDQCGADVPEPGSACAGQAGLTCWYPPGVECHCGGSGQTWDCTNMQSVDVAAPPEAVNPTTPVSAMTEQDQQAWCNWYTGIVSGSGLPPSDAPVVDGYTDGAACVAQPTAPCRAVLSVVSTSQCMANLAASECELPISALNACMETMWGGACGIDEFSCLNYLAAPGCAGTLFLDWTHNVPLECDIRVD